MEDRRAIKTRRLCLSWLMVTAIAAVGSLAGCPGPVPAGRRGTGGASASGSTGSIAVTSAASSSGAKGLGATCTIGSECGSGMCASGVCCDSACTGRCQSCAGANPGTCGPVPSGDTDPSGQCKSSACSTAACDGDGGCLLPAANTPCGGVCLDAGVYQLPGVCSDGVCSAITAPCASGMTCGATGCPTTCTSITDCAAGSTCVNGACAPIVDAGGPCTESMQCASGACISGVCCATSCPPATGGGSVQCQSSCPNAETCMTAKVPLGTACTDDGGATCDGAGFCQPVKFVFVTSDAYTGGSFGSATKADHACQNAAAAAGFGGTWGAWLSDANSDVAARFSHPTGVSYAGIGSKGVGVGTIMAPSSAALFSDQLTNGIATDQAGAPVSGPTWTGTGPDGHVSSFGDAGPATCANWTDPGANGVSGTPGVTGSKWTAAETSGCESAQHLYCFLQ